MTNLADASGYMGLSNGIVGLNSGAAPFDSTGTEYSHAEKAAFACGLIKQTTGVIGSAADIGCPGAGTAFAIGVGVVTDAVTNGIAAYDSQKSVAALKQLISQHSLASATGGSERSELYEIVQYCIGKRTSKRDRQIAKAVPVSGFGVSLYQGGKAIYKMAKGTKGVNRQKYADLLYSYAARNDEVGTIAKKIVAIIAGANFEQLLKNSLQSAMKSSA
ncbi:MAG: hypothetical protein WC782_14915 [Methylococcaceae bacterium]|jgi:hypothetical protein